MGGSTARPLFRPRAVRLEFLKKLRIQPLGDALFVKKEQTAREGIFPEPIELFAIFHARVEMGLKEEEDWIFKCHFSDVAACNIIFSNRLTSLKSWLSVSLDPYRVQILAIWIKGDRLSTSPAKGASQSSRSDRVQLPVWTAGGGR